MTRTSNNERRSAARRVMRIVREGIKDQRLVTPLVLEQALGLLRRYAAAFPDSLARAQTPNTWAAGAVHAAFRVLGGPGLTIPQLARTFGVSAGSVAQRSAELRRHWPRTTFSIEKALIRGLDQLRRRSLLNTVRARASAEPSARTRNKKAVTSKLAGSERTTAPRAAPKVADTHQIELL